MQRVALRLLVHSHLHCQAHGKGHAGQTAGFPRTGRARKLAQQPFGGVMLREHIQRALQFGGAAEVAVQRGQKCRRQALRLRSRDGDQVAPPGHEQLPLVVCAETTGNESISSLLPSGARQKMHVEYTVSRSGD